MASIPELEAALIKADAAGNADDARVLASEIRRLRSNSGMSSGGGIATEAGKGIVRGASDIGLGLSRTILPTFLGPAVGGVLNAGVEALASPSRRLIEASPSGPAEKYAGIGGEIVGGFMAPGAPGAVLKAGQLASRAVEPIVAPIARVVRNVVDPLLPGGTERAVGRTLLKLAGEKRAQVMSALAEPSEIVAGSLPTAAEAATKAGSAEFAGAQRLAERRMPTAYQDISSAQESARQKAIQSFGKTPQELEKAISSRAAQAKDLYEKASKQVLMVDDELKNLLKTDSMKKAMERVKSIETEVGKARPSPEGTMSVGRLHYLKMAMDDFVKDPDKFGISGLETAAYQGTRKKLVEWITSKSELYNRAREAFSAASKPINTMQIGQQLEKNLTAPLAAAERPGPFATAIREAPRTIEKATGSPRFTNLKQAVGEENAAAAEAVLADLSRSAQHDKLARAGMSRATQLVGEAVPGLPATGPLHQGYMIFKTVFNRFGGKLGEKELEVLAQIMKTPKATLKLMQNAAVREEMMKSIQASKVPSMTMPQRLGAGAAGAGAEALNDRR